MKQFLVIGNMNAITYKEVFPLIKANKIWLGNNYKINGGAMFFEIPESIANLEQVRQIKTNANGDKVYIARVPGVRWFTNLQHGKRNEPLQLMSMADNLLFSKHKKIRENGYPKYDNYDAIEVPFTDAIPSDYGSEMGVPISFLDKYYPEQFEIVGNGQTMADELGIEPVGQEFVDEYYKQGNTGQINAKWNNLVLYSNGKTVVPYQRILIKHKKGDNTLVGEKKFLVIGNLNAITYKEVFPLIKENKMWLGKRIGKFEVPSNYSIPGQKSYASIAGIWFTNIDNVLRHTPLSLMTAADNLRFSKHKKIRENGYPKYDNYHAIEVPFTDAVPSDYECVMGVPISFLDKYCPEQFEIVGASDNGAVDDSIKLPHFKKHNEPYINGKKTYKRILIKHKKGDNTWLVKRSF